MKRSILADCQTLQRFTRLLRLVRGHNNDRILNVILDCFINPTMVIFDLVD